MCGNGCGQFGTCTASACSCPANSTMCGGGGFGTCTDMTEDPNHCGSCGNQCNSRQYCAPTMAAPAGACVCRPGFSLCGTTCTNLQGNANHCGSCGNQCAGGQSCVNGTCTTGNNSCGAGLTACGGGGGGGTSCFNLQTDPRNCGGCGNTCANTQVCLAGTCQQYAPALGCTTCPCTECNTVLPGSHCCPGMAGQSHPICATGTGCP
jgi:hypothetical protein